MNNFAIPRKQLEEMAKIREESGISIAEQIRRGIEDYIFRYSKSTSSFMKSLGEYAHPKIGEFIRTDHGQAEVLDVLFYNDVIEELKTDGISDEEIDQFRYRVEHFLGNKEKYFECEIQYADGTIDRIDWSEYLAFRNRKGVNLCLNSKK